MKARVPGAAFVAAAGVAAVLSAPLIAQTAWSELRGEHFVLRGRLDVEQLRAVACDVETAARTLRHSAGNTASTGEVPAVVAVDGARDVREWLPQYWERRGPRPLGAYWSGLYGHHIVVRVDARPDERLRRVLHEYAHFATHLAHPEPPPWLDEGLSELWEHVTIEAGAIEIGRPVAEHLELLRSGKNWIPLEDLLSARDLPGGDDSKAAMFYAESWAVVHYLMFERSGGDALLEQLPDRAAFPTDEELRQYVRGPVAKPVKIPTIGLASPDCAGQTTVRRVTNLESLIFRAQALADGERPDAAVPLLHEALGLDPVNAEALETLGFVYFQGNKPREAAAVFDEVIAAGRGSHVGYYYRALLAGPVPELSDGSGPVRALEYLQRAVRLNPGFAPARERLRELSGKKILLPSPARV